MMNGVSSPEIGVAPPDWRLPAATRLGRVVLQIADLERSLAYYTRVIGLRVIARTDSDATLGMNGSDEPLVEVRVHAGASPVPHHGRLGLFHFAILLPDRSSLGHFMAHLARLGERAGASDHLVSEALYLRDPDGLGIEVYSDRPRGSWRTDHREIRMDTKPLDVVALMRDAEGPAWSGMPAGTTIGHVHLHVGDLAAGERYFHAALGWDKTVWSYPGALFLSAGGYHHHLGINIWAGANAPWPGRDDARLLEWQIVLPVLEDVRAALANLARHGYPVGKIGSIDAVVTDPWGTAMRLIVA